MSNPAVIKLQRKKIKNQLIWLDDNFGESIHLHINSFRVDMSNKEFSKLCDDICKVYNEYVGIEGFDFNLLNPTYIEQVLWEDIDRIDDISYDEVRLGDLLCPTSNGDIVPLPLSRCVKALEGDTKENDIYRPSHHDGQSSKERLDVVYESIKKYDYPYKKEYIILYNNDNIIRDGQHRASCLWKLKGDVAVPVMRIHLKDYKTPVIKGRNNWLAKLKRVIYNVLIKIKKIIKNPYGTFRIIKKGSKCFRDNIEIKLKKNEYDYIAKVLNNK